MPGMKERWPAMAPLTLGRKFFLYTGATLVLILLSAFVLLERQQARQWEDHLQAQSTSFARLATPQLLKLFRGEFPPRDPAALQGVYDFLSFNRDLVRFSLYSPSGRLLFRSPNFPDYADLSVPADVAGDLASRVTVPRMTIRTRELSGGRRLLDLVAPAFGPTGAQVLAVRYLVSFDSVDRRLAEVRHQFLLIGLVALGGSLLMTALAARRVTRPIRALTAGARAVAAGKLGTRIEREARDELGELARAFNDMAGSLSAGQAELTAKNQALSEANAELQRIQEHLIRTERLAAIGQLAAGVSHEIDNPVGIILGYAELLLEDLPADDPRREDVTAIIAECQRCRRITGGLLGFARTTPVQSEPVDLGSLARETLDSLRPQKLFRDVDCRLQVAPDLPLFRGDADRLRQVLVNLLLNAAQALDGKGRIEVVLEVLDGGPVLTVSDDGPGIPEELREKIFQPFFSTKPRGEGTGLGLPVCRKVVEEHGGTLTAAENPGGGTLFRVQFPPLAAEKSFDKGPGDSLG
jgi:signal transduction histidine kinase